MKVLVFKTNIQSEGKVQQVRSLFSRHNAVLKLTVDTDDEDKVLRIETRNNLKEKEVVSLVQQSGFQCEVLNY